MRFAILNDADSTSHPFSPEVLTLYRQGRNSSGVVLVARFA
jgi:hypothetical protein